MKAMLWVIGVPTVLTGLVVLAGALRLFGADWTTVDPVADVMPWFMSAITLYMTFLQGRKTWKAYAWGLVNQLLWLAFIFHGKHWGLLPLNAGLWVLYVRNLRLWYEDERAARLTTQRASDERWMKCDCHDLHGCVKCNGR